MQSMSNRGHLVANIDPLGLMQRERPRVLDLAYLGLTDADLDVEFYTGSRNGWIAPRATLREIRGAARAGVLRHDRRGVRACFRYQRAVLAAG